MLEAKQRRRELVTKTSRVWPGGSARVRAQFRGLCLSPIGQADRPTHGASDEVDDGVQ